MRLRTIPLGPLLSCYLHVLELILKPIFYLSEMLAGFIWRLFSRAAEWTERQIHKSWIRFSERFGDNPTKTVSKSAILYSLQDEARRTQTKKLDGSTQYAGSFIVHIDRASWKAYYSVRTEEAREFFEEELSLYVGNPVSIVLVCDDMLRQNSVLSKSSFIGDAVTPQLVFSRMAREARKMVRPGKSFMDDREYPDAYRIYVDRLSWESLYRIKVSDHCNTFKKAIIECIKAYNGIIQNEVRVSILCDDLLRRNSVNVIASFQRDKEEGKTEGPLSPEDLTLPEGVNKHESESLKDKSSRSSSDQSPIPPPSDAPAKPITKPPHSRRRGGPYLLGFGRSWRIIDGTIIGRRPPHPKDGDILLPLDVPDYTLISHQHARFSISADGTVTLFDNDSLNYTYVNGVPVKSAVLKDGDLIGLAGFTALFTFRDGVTNES